MPATTLRPIAIHVQEPAPGRFDWVLSEQRQGGAWSEIQRAPSGVSTYRQAMADGLLALQALVDDLDSGPRRVVPAAPGRKPTRRRGPGPPADGAAPEPAAPARRSLFGFGPAR